MLKQNTANETIEAYGAQKVSRLMVINHDLELTPPLFEEEVKRRISYHIFLDKEIIRNNMAFVNKFHELPWKERHLIGLNLNFMRKHGIVFNYQEKVPLRFFIEKVSERGDWHKSLGNPVVAFRDKLYGSVREVNAHGAINPERQEIIVDCFTNVFDGLDRFIKQAEAGLPLDIYGIDRSDKKSKELTFAEKLEDYLKGKETSRKINK